jgi:hypothetical protein
MSGGGGGGFGFLWRRLKEENQGEEGLKNKILLLLSCFTLLSLL